MAIESTPLCLLDLAGEATVATASRYFGASGYMVDDVRERRYDDAALVCADAERLRKAGFDRGHERRPIIIAVADFGDASVDALIAEGLADASLTRPLLRADVEDLLGRTVAGLAFLHQEDGEAIERDAEGHQGDAGAQIAQMRALVGEKRAIKRFGFSQTPSLMEPHARIKQISGSCFRGRPGLLLLLRTEIC